MPQDELKDHVKYQQYEKSQSWMCPNFIASNTKILFLDVVFSQSEQGRKAARNSQIFQAEATCRLAKAGIPGWPNNTWWFVSFGK